MVMQELIDAIAKKYWGIHLNPPAKPSEISDFEQRIGFSLPTDFKEFYSICNGFESNDDYIFNMTGLGEVFRFSDFYGDDWFGFSEYLINSEIWKVKVASDKYEIIYDSFEVVLTTSLHAFLERYLRGGVFGYEGLMDWSKELGG